MRLPLRITGLTSTLGLLSREGLLSFPIKALRANAFDPTFSVRNFAGEVAIESDGWRIRQERWTPPHRRCSCHRRSRVPVTT